jgi:hypothetical protein
MGLFQQSAFVKEFVVTMLCAEFQAQGTLKVLGSVQTFINDEQKSVFALFNTSLFGVERGNPATSTQIPELYIRKDRVQAIAFSIPLTREESGLLPRIEPLVAYTSHYAVQGNFHMGPENFIADFIDVAKAMFIGATEVSIFPLFQPQVAVVAEAPVVYMHRNMISLHHVVTG